MCNVSFLKYILFLKGLLHFCAHKVHFYLTQVSGKFRPWLKDSTDIINLKTTVLEQRKLQTISKVKCIRLRTTPLPSLLECTSDTWWYWTSKCHKLLGIRVGFLVTATLLTNTNLFQAVNSMFSHEVSRSEKWKVTELKCTISNSAKVTRNEEWTYVSHVTHFRRWQEVR